MNDTESDFNDYDHAKYAEGELHTGRTDPSRRTMITVAVVLGLIVAALVVMAVFF
jgi:hypothetical protein